MALKSIEAATEETTKPFITIAAPDATDAISTVLAADGVTILIGDTADKSGNILENCIDRLRDTIRESGVGYSVSTIQPTGADEVSGLEGAFTPAGAVAAKNLEVMNAQVVANPATDWDALSFMTLADASTCHWDGAAWVVDPHP